MHIDLPFLEICFIVEYFDFSEQSDVENLLLGVETMS